MKLAVNNNKYLVLRFIYILVEFVYLSSFQDQELKLALNITKRHGFCKKKETSTNDDSQENVEIDDMDSSSANISISSKKIEHINVPNDKKHITGYRIVDMGILVNVFKSLQCPLCNHQNINLSECHAEKKGLASIIY